MSTFTMNAVSMAVTATPAPASDTFDNLMLTVNEGDVLVCTDAVTGDSYFTLGEAYTVVEGSLMYSKDMLTIKDDDGMDVPRKELLADRIPLNDMFMVVTEPTVVETEPMPVTFNNMNTYDRLMLLEGWKAGKPVEFFSGMSQAWIETYSPSFAANDAYRLGKTAEEKRIEALEAELKDVTDTYTSFNKALRELNEWDEDFFFTWGDMPRQFKADILLAHNVGKAIQFHTEFTFGDQWITLNKDATPSFNDDTWYRVEPAAVESHKAEIAAAVERMEEIEAELRGLREDGLIIWF